MVVSYIHRAIGEIRGEENARNISFSCINQAHFFLLEREMRIGELKK